MPPSQSSLKSADLQDGPMHLMQDENRILRMIVERAPLKAILEALTRVAESHGSPGLLSSILLLERGGLRLRHGAAPSLPASYSRAIDGLVIGPAAGSCGSAAYRREPVIVADIASDPLWADFRTVASQHGLKACWSTPILSPRGSVLGTFAIYYREPSPPKPVDLKIIETLTSTAALAIQHDEAEQRLAEGEERFRSLNRCSPVGIFSTDGAGAFTYVNPRFHEIGGYDYEKTVSYWLANVVEPDQREVLTATWNRCTADRKEFSHEFALTAGDVQRWVNLRASPMTSLAGEYMGYVATLEDVTERTIWNARVLNESRFRQAVEDSLPCGIAALDLTGRQSYVNRAFAEMVGWAPEELIGGTAPFPYWPAEEMESIRSAFDATLRGNAPSTGFELRFRRRSGELFDALVTLAEWNDEHGQAGWIASVLDITARKQMERDLRRSEARLSLALDAGRLGAWEWSMADGSVVWSPQLEAIHGLQPGTFPGTFEAFQSDMHPEHRPGVLAAIEEALRNKSDYSVEYEIIRPDGTHRRLQAHGRVLLDGAGNTIGMAGVCRDVTDRWRSNQESEAATT